MKSKNRRNKKKRLVGISVLSIMILLFLPVYGLSQQSQIRDRKTVLDYYRLISKEYEQVRASKSEKLTIKDLPNGYLQYDTDYYQKQIALYRKTDRTALVLVGITTGGIASTDLFAFEYCSACSSKKMVDVTLDVIPRLSSRENRDILRSKSGTQTRATYAAIAYQLPAKGRLIRVLGSNEEKQDVELYSLTFQGDHFVIKR